MPSPILPPPRKPTPELLTANHRDGYFTELVQRDDSAYREVAPIKRGTKYSSLKGAKQEVIDQFAAAGGLYFCKEVKMGSAADYGKSDLFVTWIWSTDLLADDVENAEIYYLGEAVANPAFARVQTIRRDAYEANPTITLGTPLTALLGIKVTAGGTGYTTATATFGVAGTGATAEAVISDGIIVAWIVTKEGTGFTSASTVTVSGDGAGATATVIIQPVAAILTSQRKQELPDDSPFSQEFVRALRVYEVLPGPWLPEALWSDRLGPVQLRRRAVVNTGQTASQTLTTKTVYKTRDESSYVVWEIEEISSDGTGAEGATTNPAFPVNAEDIYDKDARGAVQRVSQLVRATGAEQASLVVVANGIFSRVITNGGSGYVTPPTVTIGGATGSGATAIAYLTAGIVTGVFITNPGSDYTVPTITFSAPPAGVTATGTVAVSAQLAVLTQYLKFEGNKYLLEKVVETFVIPAVPLPDEKPNGDGTTTVTTRTLALRTGITEGNALSGGNHLATSSEAWSDTISWKIVAVRPLPGLEVAKVGYNQEYGAATTRYTKRVALPQAANVPGDVKNSQVIIDSFTQPSEDSELMGILVTECMAIPPSRVEFFETSFPLPAQFTFLAGWDFPPTSPLRVQGPFLGVSFEMTPHQRPDIGVVNIRYSNGTGISIGDNYSVTSPGAGSRFFPIDNNTIHAELELTETSGMSSQVVETFDASNPSSYTPGDSLLINQSNRKVFGPIWEFRDYFVG